jgi:hypothetical protein
MNEKKQEDEKQTTEIEQLRFSFLTLNNANSSTGDTMRRQVHGGSTFTLRHFRPSSSPNTSTAKFLSITPSQTQYFFSLFHFLHFSSSMEVSLHRNRFFSDLSNIHSFQR